MTKKIETYKTRLAVIYTTLNRNQLDQIIADLETEENQFVIDVVIAYFARKKPRSKKAAIDTIINRFNDLEKYNRKAKSFEGRTAF